MYRDTGFWSDSVLEDCFDCETLGIEWHHDQHLHQERAWMNAQLHSIARKAGYKFFHERVAETIVSRVLLEEFGLVL